MKRRQPPIVDVRAHRIGRLRLLIHQFGDVAEGGPWHNQLAVLEAGDLIECYTWQLPALSRPAGPNGRFRLELDGSLTGFGPAEVAHGYQAMDSHLSL